MYKSIVYFVCAALLLLLCGCTNEPELPPSTAATAPTMTETEVPVTSEPATEPTTEPATEPTGETTAAVTTAASTTAKPTTARPTTKIFTSTTAFKRMTIPSSYTLVYKGYDLPQKVIGRYERVIGTDGESWEIKQDGYFSANGSSVNKRATYAVYRDKEGAKHYYLLNFPKSGQIARLSGDVEDDTTSESFVTQIFYYAEKDVRSYQRRYQKPSPSSLIACMCDTWVTDRWFDDTTVFTNEKGTVEYVGTVPCQVTMTITPADKEGYLHVVTYCEEECVVDAEVPAESGWYEAGYAGYVWYFSGADESQKEKYRKKLEECAPEDAEQYVRFLFRNCGPWKHNTYIPFIRAADWEEYVALRDKYVTK